MSNNRKRQGRPKEDESPRENPFHILMTEDGMPSDVSKLRLMGQSKRDYLSKRHRLQQLLKPPEDRDSETFWSGATLIEMSLLSCCELPTENSRHEDYVVPGALNRSKIPKFIGHAALDCDELGARALALAILERTWEADEEQKDILEAYNEEGEAVTISSPSTKKSKPNDSSARVFAKIGISGKADRLLGFYVGGGLKILNQWLVDASTPVPAPQPKPPPGEEKSGRPRRIPPSELWKPSKTGHLLLPLLILLTFSPFDKDLVTESKINKQIAKLSKVVDAIVAEASENPRKIDIETYTDPKVGGYLVKDVQKSLNELKASWRAKEKEKQDDEPPPANPFAKIKAALAFRMEEAKSYDRGEGEKPNWLSKAEEAAGLKRPTSCKNNNSFSNAKKRASTEELARLERKRERQEHLKRDLKKAAEERAKLLEKLRQLKQKQVQEKQAERNSQKKVQWKDGFDSTSSIIRKRELLEQVYIIQKDEGPNGNNRYDSSTDDSSGGGSNSKSNNNCNTETTEEGDGLS